MYANKFLCSQYFLKIIDDTLRSTGPVFDLCNQFFIQHEMYTTLFVYTLISFLTANLCMERQFVYGTKTRHTRCVLRTKILLFKIKVRAKIKSNFIYFYLSISCATKVQRCNLSNNCSRNRSTLLPIHQ